MKNSPFCSLRSQQFTDVRVGAIFSLLAQHHAVSVCRVLRALSPKLASDIDTLLSITTCQLPAQVRFGRARPAKMALVALCPMLGEMWHSIW